METEWEKKEGGGVGEGGSGGHHGGRGLGCLRKGLVMAGREKKVANKEEC